MKNDYEAATLRAANSLYDELGHALQAMAATIEAQQKRIVELEAACREKDIDEARLYGRLDEAVKNAELTEACANLSNAKARAVLHRFYQAPISMSSVQPVLDLAVELNPGLKGTR